MKINMRNLKVKDLFPFIRMLKEIGFKEQFRYIIENMNNLEVNDIDVAGKIINRAIETESEQILFKFISTLTVDELTAEELMECDLFDFLEAMYEVLDISRAAAFFKLAVSSMK